MIFRLKSEGHIGIGFDDHVSEELKVGETLMNLSTLEQLFLEYSARRVRYIELDQKKEWQQDSVGS